MRCVERLRALQQALPWLAMAASAHRPLERFDRALSSVDIASQPAIHLLDPAGDSRGAPPVPPGGSLAVLDSSFNPPTCAHVYILHAIARRFGATHRLLLLAKQNADKPVVGASLVQRLQMMELLALDDAEGTSMCGVTAHPLFVDKVSALRALCGPEVTIYVLVGFDTWERVIDPKYYAPGRRDEAMRNIFSTVEVVVTSRDPVSARAMKPLSVEEQAAVVRDGLPADMTRGRLHFVQNDEAMAAVSSSAARGALAANDVSAARAVLPECLHAFVVANALYE